MKKDHREFEDLPVWRDGRALVKKIYACTARSPFSRDYGLCDQIQRAVVSITSNIAEGHERGSTPDLIQFLFYAKGSAGEVRSQLYNAEDLGYISEETAESLRKDARSIGRQLSAWIQSMQTMEFRQGPKYHKEPSRKMDDFMKRMGYKMTPKGAVKITEDDKKRTENGKGKTEERGMTENGKGKTEERGMTENGKGKTED